MLPLYYCSTEGYLILCLFLFLRLTIPFFRFSADDPIHTLSFLPEYEQQTEQTEEGQVPAHDANSASFGAYSNYLPPIIAMRMLVSTARQGYIYKLSNPALLATYTYTAESLQCCASPCFLYVLTSVGLETWTLRTSDTYLPKSGMLLLLAPTQIHINYG